MLASCRLPHTTLNLTCRRNCIALTHSPCLRVVMADRRYYGAMSVLSRIHDAKVDGGWFEYSRISDKGDGTEVDSPNGEYVLDPWTYKLSFTRQGKGPY